MASSLAEEMEVQLVMSSDTPNNLCEEKNASADSIAESSFDDVIMLSSDSPSAASIDNDISKDKEEIKQVTVGVTYELLPKEVEKLRAVDEVTYSSNKISNFCALTAGAQLFLPSTSHKIVKKSSPTCSQNDQLQESDSTEKRAIENEVILLSQSPSTEENSESSSPVVVKDKVATVGVTHKLLPEEIESLRKLEKDSYSSNKISNFHSLTTGAQLFLSSSTSRSKSCETTTEKQKKMEEEIIKSLERTKKHSSKQSKKEVEEYYCDVCDSVSNSSQAFNNHIQGKKHLKKLAAVNEKLQPNFHNEYGSAEEMQLITIEDALPPKREVKRGCIPLIQSTIDLADSPCIGLSYITEILRANPANDPLYVCYMCNMFCQPATVVSHITGYKHRMNYMKTTMIAQYMEIKKLDVKKSELTKILEKHAEDIEEQDGRGCIVVEQEIEGFCDASRAMGQRALPFNPSPFQVEEIQFMPPRVRIQMLEELSNLNPHEISSDSDAKRLEFALENLQQSLMHYDRIVRRDMSGYLNESSQGHPSMVAYPMPNRWNPGEQTTWRPMTEGSVRPPFHRNRYPRR